MATPHHSEAAAEASNPDHHKCNKCHECGQDQDHLLKYSFEPVRNPASIFSHEPLQPNEIRLIDFNATSTEPVVLHVYLNDKVPEYTALSYCWGSQNCLHPFELNGQTLLLTSSLHMVFQYMKWQGFRGKLWADAICINQNDNAEKAMQIPLMGRIYSGATIVYNDFSVEFIELVHLLQPLFYDSNVSRYRRLDFSLPPFEDRFWFALIEVVQSPWFQRLWILQESLLAGHIVFCIGRLQCSLETLGNVLGTLDRLGIHDHVLAFVDDGESYILRILSLCHIRVQYQQSQQLSLFTALMYSQRLQATNLADKVYALFSITSFGDLVPIDFSAPTQRVYTRAAKVAIESEGCGLQLLSAASCQSRLSGLPSWVPDLTTQKDSPTPMDEHGFTAGLGVVKPGFAGDVSVRDSSILTARGIAIGHVQDFVVYPSIAVDVTVQEEILFAKENLDFIETCLLIGCAVLDLPEDMSVKQVFRTLVIDRPSGPDPNKRFQDSHVAQFNSLISTIRVKAEGESWLYGDDFSFVASLCYSLWLRSFFTTKNGSIGVGPAHMREEDAVILLHGGATPYIARKRQPGKTYEFIGEAYVDGVMYGEAMAQHQALGHADEVFEFD